MVKNPPAKISWRRKWQPTTVFLPGKSHGQRRLAGHSLLGHKELDKNERLTSAATAPTLGRGHVNNVKLHISILSCAQYYQSRKIFRGEYLFSSEDITYRKVHPALLQFSGYSEYSIDILLIQRVDPNIIYSL